MTDENKESDAGEIDHTTENVESVGQIILGEIEKIGGILTGDPITQAEGEFNIGAGSLHQNANKNLTAMDETEDKNSSKSWNRKGWRNLRNGSKTFFYIAHFLIKRSLCLILSR